MISFKKSSVCLVFFFTFVRLGFLFRLRNLSFATTTKREEEANAIFKVIKNYPYAEGKGSAEQKNKGVPPSLR